MQLIVTLKKKATRGKFDLSLSVCRGVGRRAGCRERGVVTNRQPQCSGNNSLPWLPVFQPFLTSAIFQLTSRVFRSRLSAAELLSSSTSEQTPHLLGRNEMKEGVAVRGAAAVFPVNVITGLIVFPLWYLCPHFLLGSNSNHVCSDPDRYLSITQDSPRLGTSL